MAPSGLWIIFHFSVKTDAVHLLRTQTTGFLDPGEAILSSRLPVHS